MSLAAGSDFSLKVMEFQQDLDYFITFFRRNEQFVPEGAKFTMVMGQSLDSLRSLGNVNQAKELFFRGTIVLHVMKRYLEAVMMFELWNSLMACQSSDSEHSTECQRLQAIVRHNPKLFANQGTKEGLFKSESECLSAPKSGLCSSDWNRARELLHDRMRKMMGRFEDVIKVQLRQYFAQRPAVSVADLSATTYKREEIVAVVSALQRNLLMEVNARNRMLAEEITTFMSAEIASRFKARLMEDQERLSEIEANLKRALSDAQAKMQTIRPAGGMAASDVRRIIGEEKNREAEEQRAWNQALGLEDETLQVQSLDRRVRDLETRQTADETMHVETAMLRVQEVENKLSEAFKWMDDLVTLMEEHQARMADNIDQMRKLMEEKAASLTQQIQTLGVQAREKSSDADRRLIMLEQRMMAQEEITEQQGVTLAANATEMEALQMELARTNDKVQKLDGFRVRMLALLASALFLAIVAILCEAMLDEARRNTPNFT